MNKKIKCDYCLIPWNDKEITKLLLCSHFLCNVDLLKLIENNLRKSNELLCPVSGCIKKIPIEIIHKLIPNNFKDFFFECENCKKWHLNKKLAKFKCNHKFCYKSLRKSNKIFCPKCDNTIMYPEIYDMRLNDTNLLYKLKNKCKVCKFSFRKHELYLLNCCEREICFSCLESLVNVNEQKCPRKNCQTKLDIQSIKKLLKEREKFRNNQINFKSENPPTNNIDYDSKKKNSCDDEENFKTVRKKDQKISKFDFYDIDKQKEDKKKTNDYNKKEILFDKNPKNKINREPSFEKIDKNDFKLNKH